MAPHISVRCKIRLNMALASARRPMVHTTLATGERAVAVVKEPMSVMLAPFIRVVGRMIFSAARASAVTPTVPRTKENGLASSLTVRVAKPSPTNLAMWESSNMVRSMDRVSFLVQMARSSKVLLKITLSMDMASISGLMEFNTPACGSTIRRMERGVSNGSMDLASTLEASRTMKDMAMVSISGSMAPSHTEDSGTMESKMVWAT